MNTNTVNISLSINEVNKVLNALGNLPYVEVFALIDKIRIQAEQQVSHQNGKEKNEVTNHAH